MLYEADSAALIDFAKRWASLGNAVAEQVERVLDCPRVAAGLIESQADQEVNPNAIDLARERLAQEPGGVITTPGGRGAGSRQAPASWPPFPFDGPTRS